MESFLNQLLIDLNDVLDDIEFDYAGTDSVPYKKLSDIVQQVEDQLTPGP